MPTTVIINLRALSEGMVTRSFHCLMHPVLLDRISQADPAMAKQIHDSGAMTPFSISPVMGVGKKIFMNKTYWVRICLLTDEIEQAFLETLEKGLWHDLIKLENHVFQTQDVIFGKQADNPWTGKDAYVDLLTSGRENPKASVFIATPMSFKKGDVHYPLPEPSLIFGNLSRRWNLFAPFKLEEKYECLGVSYSYLDMRTSPFGLRKGGTIVGIEGKLTFVFNKAREEERLYYHALLGFAFYSGIGVKTNQGMGMCRKMSYKGNRK